MEPTPWKQQIFDFRLLKTKNTRLMKTARMAKSRPKLKKPSESSGLVQNSRFVSSRNPRARSRPASHVSLPSLPRRFYTRSRSFVRIPPASLAFAKNTTVL